MVTSSDHTADVPSAISSRTTDDSPTVTMPSILMASSSPTSVNASNDKKSDKFVCFPFLPTEIRLRVWEMVAHTQHDALMGARITSRGNDNGTIDHGKLLTPVLQHDALAGREACTEAAETWRKARISTLFMPLRTHSTTALNHLSVNVDAIATLWPSPTMLDTLFQGLQVRRTNLHLDPIKTFFVGVTAIVCDEKVSPGAFQDLGEMRFRMFDLDDPALLDLLNKCNAPRKVHASNECFVETLQQYWQTDDRNKELRETWENLANSPDGGLAPTMKPVAIAVSSMEHIELRASTDFRTHLGHTKVAYSRESACRKETVFMYPPHLRARLLRCYHCSQCWPPLL